MAEQEIQKRQVAHKLRIKDILEGKYVKEEGMKPNYVLLKNNTPASRINIIGVVINSQKDPSTNLQTITVDDGSGKIIVRSFDAEFSFKDAEPGSTINLLGKIREFGSERYILPEIITQLSKEWVAVRKLELELKDIKDGGKRKTKKAAEEQYSDFEEEILIENPYQQLLDLIRRADTGLGADTEEIILKSKMENTEKKIRTLLEDR